jgi:hypothetical protein
MWALIEGYNCSMTAPQTARLSGLGRALLAPSAYTYLEELCLKQLVNLRGWVSASR